MKSLHQLEFWFVGVLIALITIESMPVGEILHSAVLAVRQWQNPNMAMDVLLYLTVFAVLVVGLNFALGLYLVRKITRPLKQISSALEELKKGNLDVSADIQEGDLLEELMVDFNETIQSLRRVIRRDHGLVKEARQTLAGCRWSIDGGKILSKKDAEAMRKRIVKTESLISFVNDHFILKKGGNGDDGGREDKN